MNGREYTDQSVYDGIRAGASWADPELDPARIDWRPRQAAALIPFSVIDGRPVNPCQRTGIRYGRGWLGHWGEQVCADGIIVALDHIVMVERDDGHGWALPGGYVEPGEDPTEAAVREVAEETGLLLDRYTWQPLPARYVPDPRASDEAWMVTVPSVVYLDHMPDLDAGSDASRTAWVPATSYRMLTEHLRARYGGEVFAAHRAMLADVLS